MQKMRKLKKFSIVVARARCSDSQLESEVEGYFLALQETRLLPR